MTRKTERVLLDSRGLAYIRESLAGANVFCAEVLKIVEVECGEVFTIAPRGASKDRLYAFQEGGLLPENLDFSRAVTLPDGQGVMMPVESLLAERARWARAGLRQAPGAVCIVDDSNPRWGDPCLVDTPTAFGVDEEVYHLLTLAEDEETFAEVIQLGNVIWHGIAAICSRAPRIDRQRVSSENEIGACARSVVELTCPAYDGEGFVGWRRAPA